MSLTIDKVHDRIEFLIKKNQWGYVSHENIDICLDMAQLELFEDYYGNPNKYQAGRPIPPVAYGQTKKVADSLKAFFTTITLSAGTAPSGLLPFPSDYRDVLDAYTTYTDGDSNAITIGLDLVRESQKAYAMNSQLLSVRDTNDKSSSFMVMVDTGFQIYPITTHTGVFTYLRLPAIPVFGYTQSGRTVTYAAGSSTQLEWSDNDINKIIDKALVYLSMALEDDKLYNEARIKDKE